MRKIYNYIMLAVVALTTVGCVDDLIDPNTPSTGNGDDVQFGLAFADLETRTIYGAEANNAFPIYWSNGDKVLVASPQCAVKSAEYEVTPVSGQSYAEAMNKAGAAGVQWGAEAADFYSIYPADKASWNTLEADKVIANLRIDSEQSANIVTNNNVYSSADMDNVIMYARTIGAQNGETVNLKYIPYSTILEFEVAIAQNKDDQGNLANWGSAKVMSMTLTAPDNTPIAGDFTFRFDGDNRVVTAAGNNNTNVITIDFTTQPLLNETNQKLYVKFALIPSADIDITKSGWTVDLEVLEGNDTETTTYTKTLAISTALKPGQIHKIKLPKLRSTEAWDPSENMDKWITTLYDYKNIYLTELSVPGAWYAGAPTSDGYQSTANIATLWNAGVRAFAVECRTSSENTGSLFSPKYTPASVVISGTQANGILGIGDFCLNGTQIRTVIKSIADQVASTVVKNDAGAIVDGEYAVLVLSYADGGDTGHRDEDHAYFINGIKTEIEKSGATNIYNEEVNASTTINHVLGKLIIKVNVDDNLPIGSYNPVVEANGTVTGGMNALISYNPFLKQIENADFETPLFSDLYWSEWKDSYKVTTDNIDADFLWCFSSANRTQANTGTNSTIPTYDQRQTALKSMIAHSKDLTEKSGHNIWFYFNAGGVETTSQTDKSTSATTFASNMNSWLLNVIKLKANGGTDTDGIMGTKGAYIESDPSPLGIVMFNQCTNATYHGPEIIQEIVHMNNKFKLLRAGADDGGEGDGVLD